MAPACQEALSYKILWVEPVEPSVNRTMKFASCYYGKLLGKELQTYTPHIISIVMFLVTNKEHKASTHPPIGSVFGLLF